MAMSCCGIHIAISHKGDTRSARCWLPQCGHALHAQDGRTLSHYQVQSTPQYVLLVVIPLEPPYKFYGSAIFSKRKLYILKLLDMYI